MKLTERLYKGADGEPSNSKMWFNLAGAVCLIKVILSGVTYGQFSMEAVDFVGLAAIIGTFGGTYAWRNKDKKGELDAN